MKPRIIQHPDITLTQPRLSMSRYRFFVAETTPRDVHIQHHQSHAIFDIEIENAKSLLKSPRFKSFDELENIDKIKAKK